MTTTKQPNAVALSVGIGSSIRIEAAATSTGLLSIAALVSGILLSSAVIVVAAKRRTG